MIDLLTRLQALGIRLELQGQELKIQAPKGAMTAELQAELKLHKAALIQYLQTINAPAFALISSVPKRYPLSPAQQRLWFLQQLEPHSARYHEAAAFVVSTQINADQLATVLKQLMQRHDILRTAFRFENGKAYQEVFGDLAVPLTNINQTDSALQDFVLKPFVLEQAPLFRVGLVQQAEQTLLVLVFHHLITDFWSAGLALQEISALWQGQALEPVTLQYGEYAHQLQFTDKPRDASLQQFWQERLSQIPLQIDMLPSAAAHSETSGAHAGLVEVALTPEELNLWEEQARQQKVTRFSYLLSAWQVFLCRWFDLEQAVIGFPTAGRHQREHEKVLGCFVNTILCPFEYLPTQNFVDYLQQQQAQIIALLQHSHLGFEQLVEIINPPRGMPYFPQLGIVMQDQWDQIPLQFDGQSARWHELDFLPPKFELLLSFLGFRHSLRLQFDPNLHDLDVMRSLLTHFKQVFIQLLKQANQTLNILRLSEIELSIPSLQPVADHQLTLLHCLVEAQAEAIPEAIALRWQEQSMTYAELNSKSNQFARALLAQGLQSGDRVAIQAAVSFDLMIALLAILKTGASYVPIDQDCPEERLDRLLQDAQVHILITDSDLMHRAEPTQAACPILLLSDLSKKSENQISSDLNVSISADQLAYMIYTSGSTGQPNGVCISHAQVTRLFSAMQAVFAHDARDVGILFHSIAFDYSIWEIWGALAAGMSLVLLDRQDARDPDKTWRLIQSERVSILNQTPSAFRYLSRVACRQKNAPALRAVILSGEKLELLWLKDFMNHFGAQTEIFNSYGITETTVFVTWRQILQSDLESGQSVIGPALPDLSLHLLDSDLQPVPTGMVGEICVAGAGLSSGYWQRPDLTSQRFITTPQGRLYRSGDLARYLPNGELVYIGRRDLQIKVRGYRIETGEIQAALESLSGVRAAHVALKSSSPFQDARLLAWVIPENEALLLQINWTASLMAALRQCLPAAMIPAEVIAVNHFPLNQNGKLDLKALPETASVTRDSRLIDPALALPEHSLEQQLRQILADLLQRSQIGLDDSFFDLGAHSLLMVEAREQIKSKLKLELELVDLFHYPTLRQLAQHLRQQQSLDLSQTAVLTHSVQTSVSQDIAIIGISLRFPGADSPAQFWQNLSTGTESILQLSPEQLAQAGISPIESQASDYVPALGWCSGIDYFDAQFFGFSPREAEILDPQHRLMLTLAWQVTEQAGYGNHQQAQSVGVFASSGLSRYLLFHLLGQPLPVGLQPMQVLVANDKDFLATRIAHKLNLTGPAMMVQSACSSSLAAVHLACESLRRGECQMALAGGVTLETRQQGYTWLEGGIYSRDGHCRPFDANATGIVGGSGGAWVLLKPLETAQADGDTIYAVIKGSAMNNDGANKAGYLAPSVTGQIEVIQRALQVAGVRPEQIGVVEAHGTGTAIGDPIEVKALQLAWKSLSKTLPLQNCALGSLKGNMGHLDAAAGIAGLIKAALMLHYQAIVPSINVTQVNPALNLEQSPFYVAQALQPWQGADRHAAVSSLGMGGTNVHVVLSAAPEPDRKTLSDLPVLIPLSAPGPQSFRSLQQAMVACLTDQTSQPSLPDLAYTLLRGRQSFNYRGFVVADSLTQAADQILALPATRMAQTEPVWVWLCPGLGSQSVAMGLVFWQFVPAYRQAIADCQKILHQIWPHDLKQLLTHTDIPPATLNQPLLMQILIFCHGYALAQTFRSLGLTPSLFLGHSFGEYLAVTLAGMLTLEEMLPLVVLRARLFSQLLEHDPAGAVMSVIASEQAVQPWLEQGISLASINGADRLTLSASRPLLQTFESRSQFPCRYLDIPHVVHHPDLDGLLVELDQAAAQIQWQPPQLPVWSALLNDWHKGYLPEDYWSRQARECLRFDLAIDAIKQSPLTYQGLELGSGRHLSSLLQQQQISSLGGGNHSNTFWQLLGQIWQQGFHLNWQVLDLKAQRIPLPTTPLNPQRHWIEASSHDQKNQDLRPLAFADSFQVPVWKRSWISRAGVTIDTLTIELDESLDLTSTDWPMQLLVKIPQIFDYSQALALWQRCRQLILKLSQANWSGTIHLLCQAFSPVTHVLPDVPWASLLLGLVRTVPLEFPGIELRLIESDSAADLPESEWLQSEAHVAWRQGFRWLPDWQTATQDKLASEAAKNLFKQGGVYLITGISGGLGQVFSQYLHTEFQARVIGVSRHAILAEHYQECFALDITDPDAVLGMIQVIQQKYVRLDGVIHTAGIPGHHLLAQLEPEHLHQTWAAKVLGSLNLQAAFKQFNLKPDFVLLCSALASQLGAPGQAAYSSANAWLDYFAQQQGLPWISVNWGAWQGAGMAVRALEQLPMPFKALYAQLLKWGITPEWGTQAFAQSIHLSQQLGSSQILASPLALQALQDFQTQSWQQILKAGQSENSGLDLATLTSEPGAIENLANPPQGETEALIARIWHQSLGVWPNRDQRFSELGGDSLMILQVKSLLESHWLRSDVQELALTAFLQDLPLQDLARALEHSQPEQSVSVRDQAPAERVENPLANADLLVKLNRQSQGPALYFVHAVSGTVFPFRHLAESLPNTMYGLQSQGLVGKSPHSDIRVMASAYWQTVITHGQATSSDGYWIGGWSFGGLVAYEMACQAMEQGQKIKQLVLLDMQAPTPGQIMDLKDQDVRARFEADLNALGPVPGLEQMKQRLWQVFEANVQATLSFSPRLCDVPTLLLVAEDGFGKTHPEPDLGWSRYLPDLQVIRIPGDHYSCLEPEQLKQWVPHLGI